MSMTVVARKLTEYPGLLDSHEQKPFDEVDPFLKYGSTPTDRRGMPAETVAGSTMRKGS